MEQENLALNHLYNVRDKVVLITGGARGIGLMLTKGFVANGAIVYIASRNQSNCAKVALELNTQGPGQCVAIPCDISTEVNCLELVRKFRSYQQHLDVLIHNSGVVWGETFDTYPEKAWDKIYNVNVKAPFFLTRAFLPLLDRGAQQNLSEGARVLLIGSIAGKMPQAVPTYAYDVSKAGVHHLTRVLASSLCRRNNGGFITVNCIAPGFVPSGMAKGIAHFMDLNSIQEGIPLGTFGTATDLAGSALFLSSRAGKWITGITLTLDGGATEAQAPALWKNLSMM